VRLESTPRGVLFYETCADAAAFEVHRGSAQLARFKAALVPLTKGERPLRRGLT
jgi:quinol monooxygenase YgiN